MIIGNYYFFKTLLKENIFLARVSISLDSFLFFFRYFFVKFRWGQSELPVFCDLLSPFCVYVDGILACKMLQAENMANTIDEALIFMHLSAIQTHLYSKELFNTAYC